LFGEAGSAIQVSLIKEDVGILQGRAFEIIVVAAEVIPGSGLALTPLLQDVFRNAAKSRTDFVNVTLTSNGKSVRDAFLVKREVVIDNLPFGEQLVNDLTNTKERFARPCYTDDITKDAINLRHRKHLTRDRRNPLFDESNDDNEESYRLNATDKNENLVCGEPVGNEGPKLMKRTEEILIDSYGLKRFEKPDGETEKKGPRPAENLLASTDQTGDGLPEDITYISEPVSNPVYHRNPIH
jgi:hypothetical protein